MLYRRASERQGRHSRLGRSVCEAWQNAGVVFRCRGGSADEIAKRILDTYLEPDKSFVELRDMAKSGTIDLLYQFSMACREEFERFRAQQL